MEVVAWKGLLDIQDLYMLQPVCRMYYTMLCQGILPLACSAIISFWGRQAKSCGLEGSFEHPGVYYQHHTHTSACSTCTCCFTGLQGCYQLGICRKQEE